MDEQLIELRLEAESHAIAHAMDEEALASFIVAGLARPVADEIVCDLPEPDKQIGGGTVMKQYVPAIALFAVTVVMSFFSG